MSKSPGGCVDPAGLACGPCCCPRSRHTGQVTGLPPSPSYASRGSSCPLHARHAATARVLRETAEEPGLRGGQSRHSGGGAGRSAADPTRGGRSSGWCPHAVPSAAREAWPGPCPPGGPGESERERTLPVTPCRETRGFIEDVANALSTWQRLMLPRCPVHGAHAWSRVLWTPTRTGAEGRLC